MSFWPWVLAASVLLVAGPLLLTWVWSRSRDRAREGLPGHMLALRDGLTHVRSDGLPGRPVAVLVHGLTTPSWVFDAIAEGLVVQGWRVVRYDLWGRGGSDMPRGAQGRDLFVRQLGEVIEAEVAGEPVLLVGYSMGAAICAAYAETCPERLRGLVLLAPAGLGLRMDRFTRFAVRTPLLGDWLWAWLSGYGMRSAGRKAEAREGPSAVPGFAGRMACEARTRGYRRAVLSSLRNMLAEDMAPTFRALSSKRVEMLAVWGGRDALIDRVAPLRLERLVADAVPVVVADAGHGLPHTHPRAVLKAILQFVRRP